MAQIFCIHKDGYSECRIGVKLNFSKTVVHNAMWNFKNYGTFCDMGISGCPSIRDDYIMKHIATHSPSSSCKRICAALLAKGTNVSFMTILSCLKSHKPAGKPCLTNAVKFICLNFAK